jgi:Flp pilus assembly protein TadG
MEPQGRAFDGQDGSNTTELVLLMPVVLTLVMLVVQFGLWMHARQVVLAAAQEALSVAQQLDATSDAGRGRAEEFLAQAGGVRYAAVVVDRQATTATASVTGVTPAVVPGFSLGVSAVVEGPIERFVSEPDR